MQHVAAEARDIVRRAAGDVAGLTVAAQIRQAARHLGFPADHWRPRECWYARCASATALDDLRQRAAAADQQKILAVSVPELDESAAPDHPTLVQRLDAIRAGLVELQRQVDALAAEIARSDP